MSATNETAAKEPAGPAKDAETKLDPADIASVIPAIKRDATDEEIKTAVVTHIGALATKHGVTHYRLLFLYDDKDDITHWHANRIYSAASSGEPKHTLLLIHSNGGHIEPAYLISKTCMRLSNGKFVAAIPRRAKSAATLISLGAHEIHMGLMSELGPIDPQVGGFPALGMQNALSLLADLSCRFPGSSEMLGRFLSEKLDLRILGYFERISESAIQYAERLLDGKPLPDVESPKSVADRFVNHYKDHGFVVDVDETEKLLGKKIVRQGTPEYRFANNVYESLDFLRFFIGVILKKEFDYVGGIESGLVLRDKKPE